VLFEIANQFHFSNSYIVPSNESCCYERGYKLGSFARCQKRGRQALITLSLAVNVNYCIYYSALKATVTYYGVNCEITSQNNDNDDQIK
jgi:hypothetical protein